MRQLRPSHNLAPRQDPLAPKHPFWPKFSLGSLQGCAATDFRDDTGRSLPGANHLYTILISESLLLIWKLRCEWRLQRGASPAHRHTTQEIQSRWLAAVDIRLRLDRLLTNRS